MTLRSFKTVLIATIALTAVSGMALPAAATTYSRSHAAWVARHHAWLRDHAYRAGYRHGFRDGHYATAEGAPDMVTGRSAYVEPAPYPGMLGNGGLLGTGLLNGNGLLGTGVLDGQGALGVGVLGF